MAQVYQFTDANGETRLLAEIVPDPAGTPFNGGTIDGGGANPALTVAAPAGIVGVEIDSDTADNALQVAIGGNETLVAYQDGITGQVTVKVFDLIVNDGLVGTTFVYEHDAGRTNIAAFDPTGDGSIRLRVYDHTQAAIFEVRDDGSLHGKTGQTLTFDL